MGLTMKERQAVTAVRVARYRRASKKQKGRLLDELVALTGYNRWYAVGLLCGQVASAGGRCRPAQRRVRQRRRRYDVGVLAALRRVWVIMDCKASIRITAANSSTIQLLRYTQQERITFTRGRAWQKNAGGLVEQKNYSVVRRAVGYARYEGDAPLRLLNELYAELRLYTNFFQPVMKLMRKERTGAKVKKTYDRPRTPYQRLLDSSALSKPAKQQLRRQYAGLNPAELKRHIVRLQKSLVQDRPAPAAGRSVQRGPVRGIIVIPQPKSFAYGNDFAPTARLGPTRASVRGRIGHFVQCPFGRSIARVSGREEARITHGSAVASASAGASSSAASQGRAGAKAYLILNNFTQLFR